MNLSLKGKTALVCGSTQGIGKASALELSKLGASCVLIARDEKKLADTIKELDSSQGQQHQYIAADFQHPQQLKEKVDASIIGGYVLRVGDKQQDASLRAKLTKIGRDFKENRFSLS